MSIPKVFHQIWLQGEMPEEHKYLRDHMLELHPGWEYKFWTEKNRPKLFNEEYYNFYKEHCFKSDILRYELLLKYGGVYVDTDFLFLKNIEPCLQKEYLFIDEFDQKSRSRITNCLFGVEKDSYIMKYVVLKIQQSMMSYQEIIKTKTEKYAGLRLIGPGFFDKSICSIIGKRDCFSNKYFIPFNSQEVIMGQFEKPEEAYAIHLWNSAKRIIKVHKTLPCYKRVIKPF